MVDYDNVEHFAQAVARVAREMPKDEQVAEYMAREHSWDARAAGPRDFFRGRGDLGAPASYPIA